jgi:hypothetical protein
MGFWNTFLRTWQIRKSIKIQETLEDYIQWAKDYAQTQENMPQIIEELNKKNKSWQEIINKSRKDNDVNLENERSL